MSMQKQEGFQIAKKNLKKAIKDVLSRFDKRTADILCFRYGLNGQKQRTLEDIGKVFGITRERVRQIIREAVKKALKAKITELDKIFEFVSFTIEQKSGIIEAEKLIGKVTAGDKNIYNSAKFVLELSGLQLIEKSGEMKKSYISRNFNQDDWEKNKNIARNILELENRLLLPDELEIRLLNRTGSLATVKKILDYLEVSEEIKINNFGKWGLSTWPEVTPRNTRDKAYVIFREKGVPLHFREVANLIDKHKLNRRRTHIQTVHNELIKDNRFVLIGRGVYALAEWGYRKGTVKEVLEEILRKNSRPMKSEEIMEEILKVRMIKKSTVMINLNNFFSKNEKNEFTLSR